MNKTFLWLLWGIISVATAGYYINTFFWSEDKTPLLIGDTTHGHYQIEMACTACHTEAFAGTEGLQQACLNCHAEELQLADDSHPKSKFTDPRNADRVAILDARYCITCHTEHQQESTLAMGVTIPEDYCYYCHQETLQERASHNDLEFDTCATSGCHNYHDNRALYEDFLLAHANEPPILTSFSFPELESVLDDALGLGPHAADAPRQYQSPATVGQWHESQHADAGVNCSDCHQPESSAWIEKPGLTECKQCHEFQVAGFTSGKHGMRLSSQLDKPLGAMSPALAKQHAFQPDSIHQQQNCNACHGAHDFNTQSAAVDSCLNCHDDRHSNNFLASPHGLLWQQVQAQSEPEIKNDAAVSCATCHMPREDLDGDGRFHVQHNQNANLRPNEKMIRGVCLHCHGLAFSIDALADPALIDNNFNGRPAQHVPSIDWAVERLQNTE